MQRPPRQTAREPHHVQSPQDGSRITQTDVLRVNAPWVQTRLIDVKRLLCIAAPQLKLRQVTRQVRVLRRVDRIAIQPPTEKSGATRPIALFVQYVRQSMRRVRTPRIERQGALRQPPGDDQIARLREIERALGQGFRARQG